MTFNTIADTRYGPFVYNKNDQIIGRALSLYGEYCEGELELLRQLCRPGSVVADIGANIGAITVPLATHVGMSGFVYAFEPQRVVFQTLCANVALQSLTNVECIAAGVGAERGHVTIPDLDYDREANFGGFELSTFQQGRKVPIVTLDDYRDVAHFDLIKIDVEGMELEVLRGGEQLIREQRPLLYVENDRPEKSEALVAALQRLEYNCFWHRPLLFNANNYRHNPDNIFGSASFVNMLCLPRERPAQLDGFDPVEWRSP